MEGLTLSDNSNSNDGSNTKSKVTKFQLKGSPSKKIKVEPRDLSNSEDDDDYEIPPKIGEEGENVKVKEEPGEPLQLQPSSRKRASVLFKMGDVLQGVRDPKEASESGPSSGSTERNKFWRFELETDEVVLERRRKQIEYGKNTPEYHNYKEAIAKKDRESFHPRTPKMKRKYSRRAWDGLVHQWRIQLHLWSDPEALVRNKRKNVESGSSESSRGGEAMLCTDQENKTGDKDANGDPGHKEVSWFEETEEFYDDHENDNDKIHITV